MLQQLFLYIHLIGFALGFGGAMVSDAMFFSSIRDKKISDTEIRFMKLGGILVWIGLAILTISGVGLFFLDSERLSQSSKFIVKMGIVLIIALNGLLFHLVHMKHIKKYRNKSLHKSKDFLKKSIWIVMSGAVSVCSWFSAALLGSLGDLPYQIQELASTYLFALSTACIMAVFVHQYLFGQYRRN